MAPVTEDVGFVDLVKWLVASGVKPWCHCLPAIATHLGRWKGLGGAQLPAPYWCLSLLNQFWKVQLCDVVTFHQRNLPPLVAVGAPCAQRRVWSPTGQLSPLWFFFIGCREKGCGSMIVLQLNIYKWCMYCNGPVALLEGGWCCSLRRVQIPGIDEPLWCKYIGIR